MRGFPYMYIRIFAEEGGGTRYVAFDIVGTRAETNIRIHRISVSILTIWILKMS